MAAIHSAELKRDAARIAQTCGLTRRQVGIDLRLGHSALNHGVKRASVAASPADPNQNVMRKAEWLRRENRILKDLSRTRKQSGGLLFRRTWWPPLGSACLPSDGRYGSGPSSLK